MACVVAPAAPSAAKTSTAAAWICSMTCAYWRARRRWGCGASSRRPALSSAMARHLRTPAARLAGVHQAQRVALFLEFDLLVVDRLHSTFLDGHHVGVEDLAAALRLDLADQLVLVFDPFPASQDDAEGSELTAGARKVLVLQYVVAE